MSVLTVQNIGIQRNQKWLIENINLQFEAGQLTSLIGVNGAGKTTLLGALGRLWAADQGDILLHDRRLTEYSHAELAKIISFVPQSTHISFSFSVWDIVMMGRNPHIKRFENESDYDRHCVEQALIETDTVHLAQRSVTELSGGERQRVIIARSLASEAAIILLDEPIASLDIAHALHVLDLCQGLAQQGKTIILSLHDINLATRFSDQMVLLHKGQVFAQGSATEVLSTEHLKQVFNVNVESLYTTQQQLQFYFSLAES